MDTGATEYFLSCYLTPPGPGAVFSVRHDQNVALWERRGEAVSLRRVWELERVSGQKHHFWPLYTPQRAEAFLGALLAEEGLTLADIAASWGTPGLPAARPVPMPKGAEDFPLHSLAHLFSGVLRDTRPSGRSRSSGSPSTHCPTTSRSSGPTATGTRAASPGPDSWSSRRWSRPARCTPPPRRSSAWSPAR